MAESPRDLDQETQVTKDCNLDCLFMNNSNEEKGEYPDQAQ